MINDNQGSGDILAGWFWLWVPGEGAVKVLAGAVVSKDLTGARESIAKVVHLAVGQRLHVLTMWPFPQGCL